MRNKPWVQNARRVLRTDHCKPYFQTYKKKKKGKPRRFSAVLGHAFAMPSNESPGFFGGELGGGTAASAWQLQLQRNILYFFFFFLKKDTFTYSTACAGGNPPRRSGGSNAGQGPRGRGEPGAPERRWAGRRRPLMGVPFLQQLPSQSCCLPPSSSPRLYP